MRLRPKKKQTFEQLMAESNVDGELLAARVGWKDPTNRARIEHWKKYSNSQTRVK